jgi:hypothetical protein
VKPRGIGRGRLVIALGALLAVAGCFLPWWSVGGVVTEQQSGNGFDTVLGVVVFVCALLLITVMVLPYASRDRHSPLDRPSVYVLLLVLAGVAFAYRLIQIAAPDFDGLGLPQAIPGAWITGIGLVIVLFGVVEVFNEARSYR